MGSPAYDENWGDEEDDQQDEYSPAYSEDWGDEGASGRPDRIAVNVKPRPPEDDGFMKRLMAFGDGLAGNWGGEVAGALSRGGTAEGGEATGALMDEAGYDPDYQAQRVDADVTQASQQHPYYNAGGHITRGLGVAALAGPGIMAQAGAGALDSAAAEYGDSHSGGRAVGRGIVGGALSGAAATGGKILGRVLSKKHGAAPAAASADDLVMPQASAPAREPIDVPLAPRGAPRAPEPPLSPGDPELPHVLSQRDRIHSLDDLGARSDDTMQVHPGELADEGTSQLDLGDVEELPNELTRAAPYAPGEQTSVGPAPDEATSLYQRPVPPRSEQTQVGPYAHGESTQASYLPNENTQAAYMPNDGQTSVGQNPLSQGTQAAYMPPERVPSEVTQAGTMPVRPPPAEQTQAAYMPPPPPPPGPMPRPPGPTSYLPDEATQHGQRVGWQPQPRPTGFRPNEQTQVMGAPQVPAEAAAPPAPPGPMPPPPPPAPAAAPQGQPGKYDRAIDLAMKFGQASPQVRALVAGGRMLGKAIDPSRVSNPYASPGAIGGMEVAAEGLAGLYRDQKPAPANKTTVNFAIKKLLTDSKGAGLTDQDTSDLMTTFQEGDQAGIATKLWTLGQKNPLFKKKYEEVLTTVGGGHR